MLVEKHYVKSKGWQDYLILSMLIQFLITLSNLVIWHRFGLHLEGVVNTEEELTRLDKELSKIFR